MLSLNEIIQILEPKQSNISNEISNVKVNNKIKLNSFYDLILDNNEYYKYENNNENNTLIMSLLGICNTEYLLYTNNEKRNIIKELINKMYDELDEKQYHKKFGYSRKKIFKKSLMKELLVNSNVNIDDMNNNSLKQYLADYFGVNIIIFIFDENNNYIGSNYYKYNEYVEEEPSVMNVLIEKKNNIYHPILKNSSSDNILTLSDNKELLNKIKNFIPKLILEHINEEENESEEECYELNDKISLMKLKLDKIKIIAKENDIQLKKLSEKTGKLINLKKEEIVDDIITKMSSNK
jgi:hypothetical protein